MPTTDLTLHHHATPNSAETDAADTDAAQTDAVLARCTALEIMLEAALIALAANPQAIGAIARQSATRLRAAAAFAPGNAGHAMAVEDQVTRITRNLLRAAPPFRSGREKKHLQAQQPRH